MDQISTIRASQNEELPVDVKVTYKLDGEEIEPSELAGKSGKVTIRFDYSQQHQEDSHSGQQE